MQFSVIFYFLCFFFFCFFDFDLFCEKKCREERADENKIQRRQIIFVWILLLFAYESGEQATPSTLRARYIPKWRNQKFRIKIKKKLNEILVNCIRLHALFHFIYIYKVCTWQNAETNDVGAGEIIWSADAKSCSESTLR